MAVLRQSDNTSTTVSSAMPVQTRSGDTDAFVAMDGQVVQSVSMLATQLRTLSKAVRENMRGMDLKERLWLFEIRVAQKMRRLRQPGTEAIFARTAGAICADRWWSCPLEAFAVERAGAEVAAEKAAAAKAAAAKTVQRQKRPWRRPASEAAWAAASDEAAAEAAAAAACFAAQQRQSTWGRLPRSFYFTTGLILNCLMHIGGGSAAILHDLITEPRPDVRPKMMLQGIGGHGPQTRFLWGSEVPQASTSAGGGDGVRKQQVFRDSISGPGEDSHPVLPLSDAEWHRMLKKLPMYEAKLQVLFAGDADRLLLLDAQLRALKARTVAEDGKGARKQQAQAGSFLDF